MNTKDNKNNQIYFEKVDLSELKGGLTNGTDSEGAGCGLFNGVCSGDDSGCGLFNGNCQDTVIKEPVS